MANKKRKHEKVATLDLTTSSSPAPISSTHCPAALCHDPQATSDHLPPSSSHRRSPLVTVEEIEDEENENTASGAEVEEDEDAELSKDRTTTFSLRLTNTALDRTTCQGMDSSDLHVL
jgi:hypothetical protein